MYATHANARYIGNRKRQSDGVQEADSRGLRDAVGPDAVKRLEKALSAARRVEENRVRVMPRSAEVINGLYDSVYNARWRCVITGKMYKNEPFGMKLLSAKTEVPFLWSRGDVDMTPELGQSYDIEEMLVRSEKVPVVAVLSSALGWPNRMHTPQQPLQALPAPQGESDDYTHLYIRKEMMRVWYIIEEELDRWLKPDECRMPQYHIAIGTAGIGKTRGLGPFLLYQLLHYSSEELCAIAYFSKGEVCILHRHKGNTPGMAVYYNVQDGVSEIERMANQCRKGYAIFDEHKKEIFPYSFPPCWGALVMSTPSPERFEHWVNRYQALPIYINCHDNLELKVVHALGRFSTLRQEVPLTEEMIEGLKREWDELELRVRKVGPLIRYVLGSHFHSRWEDVEEVLQDSSRQYRRCSSGASRYSINWKEHAALFKTTRYMMEGAEVGICEPVSVTVHKKLNSVDGGR
ncbi:unnamed protein product [Trypanosoma congolense IL3000]|uniref:WGS project CAEQ00000000 data, annotated contig 887 n=1 Tax=Trypanosoma congolense (strain IL3000) TaxID=1068625 RepID=F9WJ91_TRYCI|nr:unnamed protein product [Trypanosoma congolense IL3000]